MSTEIGRVYLEYSLTLAGKVYGMISRTRIEEGRTNSA